MRASAMIIALLKGQTVETAPAPTRDVNKEAQLLSQLQSSVVLSGCGNRRTFWIWLCPLWVHYTAPGLT